MTASPTRSLAVRIPLGDSWFDLPLDEDTDREALQERVDARLGREPDLAPARERLVDMLAHFSRDARERGAVGAALYWRRHDLDIVTVATLYTAVCPRPEGPVDAEIARLAGHLAERYATDRFDPAVETCELPAGQALRVRVISETERDEDRHGVGLLETVQYWIPVASRPASLLLNFSTPNLAGADRLVAELDAIAARVELRT